MSIVIPDRNVEQHYRRYVRDGADDKAMALTLLGDSSYIRRFRMPKHNGPIDSLQSPEVAIRHAHELGMPPSKEAHRQRADYFLELKILLLDQWSALVDECVQKYGKHGPLISNIYRTHFPEEAKERLRFLSHGANMADDAARVHLKIIKSRSPYFSW